MTTAADPLEHMAFKTDGHFAEKPADWGNPEQDLKSRQFMAVLDACTEKLPAVQGRLFLMREWLEMSSDEICKELGHDLDEPVCPIAPGPFALARMPGTELVWPLDESPAEKSPPDAHLQRSDRHGGRSGRPRSARVSEQVMLRMHMAMCKACPPFERQMLTMRNAMKQWRNYDNDE